MRQNSRRLILALQSAIDFSHQRAVTDLHWMPYHGEINSKGVLSYDNATEKVTNQFISIAGDGMVLFWDLRFRDKKKQARRSMLKKDRDGDQELWSPIYSIKLQGLKPSGGKFTARELIEPVFHNSHFIARFQFFTHEPRSRRTWTLPYGYGG